MKSGGLEGEGSRDKQSTENQRAHRQPEKHPRQPPAALAAKQQDRVALPPEPVQARERKAQGMTQRNQHVRVP
jgi:hypothetical protein